jgi:hypothetical protein
MVLQKEEHRIGFGRFSTANEMFNELNEVLFNR